MSRLGTNITVDQIDDWFKIGKAVSKVATVPRSTLGGRPLDPQTGKAVVDSTEAPFIPPYRRHTRVNNPNQVAYAEHYQQVEARHLTTSQSSTIPAAVDSKSGHLNQLEVDSVISGMSEMVLPENQTVEQAVKVYNNYDFQHKYDKSLPISQYFEQVLSNIESNQVTIVQGSTGSGKTTQVPQFILDHYAAQNRYCNIVVTQPRRIAAMSIARRVCQERGWSIGGICGYQVGMDKVASEDTRLIYMTTGVLLQILINRKEMFHYTHVILDEVHERDQDTDFSLLVVRKLLRTNSRGVKVVLMSATFDTDMFANYFCLPVRGQLEPATVVNVEGKIYTVSEYYVEDLKSLGELPFLERENPKITPEAFHLAKELIQQFDNLEIQEQGQSTSGFSKLRGSVLVFLPGLAEIMEMDSVLTPLKLTHGLWILPLHSSITGEEQSKVFYDAPPGKRKVILSTNIAESSITVRDIKYVIDFCLTKHLVADPDTNYTSLHLDWTSKASSTQRKGRAGRVSNGRVYRMITRHFWQEVIPDYSIPEMKRCPLEQLVLKSKLLDMGEPKAILGLALSPPNLDDIERTVLLLKEIGALSNNCTTDFNPHDGDLTFVGRVLAQLPLDIHLGKLLILGNVFGLLEDCLIIAASLSLKSFFSQPFKANLEAYSKKLAWASGSLSDCIAIINAYKVWRDRKDRGLFRNRSEVKWGIESMIQIRRIHEVAELVDELAKRLSGFNIRLPHTTPRTFDVKQNPFILKLVLAGAFYPNYFIRGMNDEEDAARALSGHNPFTTVMLRGLPANQGTFYKKPIEMIFEKACSSDFRVDFEETRCFVDFGRTVEATNQITMPVYLAVKMRLLRIPLEIALLDEESTRLKEKQLQVLQESRMNTKKLRTHRLKSANDPSDNFKNEGSFPHQVTLPSPKTTVVPIFITEVITCGHFWAQYGDEDTFTKLRLLQDSINSKIQLQPLNEEPKPGMYCLAPYEDPLNSSVDYYRARVIQIIKANVDVKVKVFFFDYGNVDNVLPHQLCRIPPDMLELEFQAFECELCNIKPRAVSNTANSEWSENATKSFIEMVSQKTLFAQVYSIVHGVLRLELLEKKGRQEWSINAAMVNMRFAEKAEESYASKQNHLKREEEAVYGAGNEDWMEVSLTETSEGLKRGRKIRLIGPFSPYEMSFYSVTNNGRLRTVRIERDSVNSVALDSEPHDVHDRMMVAGFVGMNPSGSTMMVRDTTILPNIHGLPALLGLLFTPSAELRTNRCKSRYTGALLGLGCNPETGEPSFPDHDIELTFDTHFDVEDLFMINSVRMAINIAVESEDNVADWGPEAIVKIQTSARNKLLQLVQRQRESVDRYEYPWPYRWNRIDPEDILKPELESMPQGGVMLNLHCGIAIAEEEKDDNERLLEEKRAHVTWLHTKANRSAEPEELSCQLCSMLCQTPRDLMFHLATKLHRQEEAKLMKK